MTTIYKWTVDLKNLESRGKSVSITVEAPDEASARRLIESTWGHVMRIVGIKRAK